MKETVNRWNEDALFNAPMDRTPPQNIEAEQAVLGCMLIGGAESVDNAAELLESSDFYRDIHRTLFSAMQALNSQGMTVDIITLRDYLTGAGKLEECGGTAYIMALTDVLPSPAMMPPYAKIVRDKSYLRQLIEQAARAAGLGYSNPESVEQVLADAAAGLLQIGDRRHRGAFSPLSSALTESLSSLGERIESGGKIRGLPTGLTMLDYTMSGMRKGDLIIIAARPSMGKTGLAATAGLHVALKEGLPVAMFSMEMSNEQIADRLICAEADVNTHHFDNGRVKEEQEAIHAAAGRLWDAKLWIDDSSALTVQDMRTRLRRMSKSEPLGLIIVDYLQLLSPEGKGNGRTRNDELGEIAKGLKALAREFDCPLIALSQLSRAVERREDKRPMLSDLRDSGTLEAEADVVGFIYRDAYYTKEGHPDATQEAEIIIAKNRKGPTGTARVGFIPSRVKFVNREVNRS